MNKDKNMICYGLVLGPKEVFSTTNNLKDMFGNQRVLMFHVLKTLTGISIGAAINNVRSVVSHQRIDFLC